MLKLFTVIIITLNCLFVHAQTTIYPGNFRCISLKGPLMNYWLDENTNSIFAKDLDSLLRIKRNWELTNLETIKFLPINKNSQSNPILTYPHLNIGLIEYGTYDYIKQFNLDFRDTGFAREVISVLRLQVQLEGKNQSIIFEKDLDVFVKKGLSNGIGIPINNLDYTRKGFLETLKKSLAILFDSTTTNEAIELRVAGAFVGDNFILAKTSGLPRTQISTTKGISKFKYNDQEQLIRWGDQLYKDVFLKGKNKTLLSEKLSKAFEASIDNEGTKPIFLIQEGRDIVGNKNYLLQLAATIGADLNTYATRPIVTIIPGNFQALLNEKDSIAVFEIQTYKSDSTKKLFIHQVSNGFDTSSIGSIEASTKEISIVYDFLIKGKIYEQPFEIKIAGDRFLREFYFNNELICIANGNKAPERLVMLNKSISPEILNALFIIGFNSFFQ